MVKLSRIILSGVIALFAVTTQQSALAAERLAVEFTREPTGAAGGLEYRYTITVKKHGSKTPVRGADFTIATDMPRMPGAHHMRPVTAEPGPHPGTYRATIHFDMPGEWSLIFRFSKPHRDQVVVTDRLEKEDGGMGHGPMHMPGGEKTEHGKMKHPK